MHGLWDLWFRVLLQWSWYWSLTFDLEITDSNRTKKLDILTDKGRTDSLFCR